MSKKTLLLGAVASIIAINSVFADTTVTSKAYVDTTRQATIPAAGTNANTPGSTVVTYTGTAGQIGERGICNDPGEDDCNAGDLVTLDQVMNFVAVGLDNAVNNMPTTTTTNKVCAEWVSGQAHTDTNCLLWNLVDQTVYGGCKSHAECIAYCDAIGTYDDALCNNGNCECNIITQ